VTPRSTDRGREIQSLLAAHGEVNVEELAKMLNVTASTIRRDLAKLTRDGNVARTYGGAVISSALAKESTFYQRSRHARAAKNAIGRWAAGQLVSGETAILDAGTTVSRVAHHLRGRDRLTVITNGITSINELADDDDIKMIVLAGWLRHSSQSFVGPLADLTLERLSADRVFLGADGLLASYGICEASVDQTRTKELMMRRATHVYVLADSSKLGQAPFNAWAPLAPPWTLVTDDTATEEQLEPFRELAEVVVVPAAPPSTAPSDEDPTVATAAEGSAT
jgi:DeoR/GlpR family transcriptional regulator of sugar metabolism